MRKFRGMPPTREQSFRFGRICLNQFDRGLANVRGIVIRQKYGAVVISADELAQAKFSVNDLAHPLRRGLGHVNPLANSKAPASGVLPGRSYPCEFEKCRA